jgi:hypothetical protein
MKHLLTGVAMAAAFAIAAPAWAQTTAPMTPSSPPAGSPPPAAAPAKPMAKKPMHHMAMHHHRGWMGSGDQATEELNRQELARITSGNTMAPPPPSPGMSAPPPPAK